MEIRTVMAAPVNSGIQTGMEGLTDRWTNMSKQIGVIYDYVNLPNKQDYSCSTVILRHKIVRNTVYIAI
jgi:hypothetical protein